MDPDGDDILALIWKMTNIERLKVDVTEYVEKREHFTDGGNVGAAMTENSIP